MMIRHLLRALLACAALLLVFSGVAYADQVDEWNSVMEQVKALQDETYSLDTQVGEVLDGLAAIDPDSENATDALPILAEAEAILAQMTENVESLVALWDSAGALAESEEQQTYVTQAKEIAATYLEAYAVLGDILERVAIFYDPDRRSSLGEAELDTLYQEATDLQVRSEELVSRLDGMERAAQQYFVENELDEPAGGGRSLAGWIAYLTVASAGALACGIIAGRKNRSIVGWGIFGFVIPIAALVGIAVVRKLEPQPARLSQPRL